MNKITKDKFKFLIDKNIIKKGMFINVDNCEELCKILSIKENKDNYTFNCKQMVYSGDGAIFEVNHSAIKSIEEMDVNRFFESYEVDDILSIIKIEEPTDVKKDVIGKDFASILDYELEDGMKFVLLNDKTEKLNNKTLTVRGVGEKIELVAPRGRPKENA